MHPGETVRYPPPLDPPRWSHGPPTLHPNGAPPLLDQTLRGQPALGGSQPQQNGGHDAALHAQLDALKAMVRARDAEVKTLKENVEALREKERSTMEGFLRSQDETAGHMAVLAAKQEAESTLRSEMEQLRSALSSVRDERDMQASHAANLTEELENVQPRIDALTATLGREQSQREELMLEVELTRKDAAEQQRRAQLMVDESTAHMEALEAKGAAEQILKEEISQLRRDLATAEDERTMHSSHAATLMLELEAAAPKVDAMEAALLVEQQGRQAAIIELEDLKSVTLRGQAERDALRQELQRLTEQHAGVNAGSHADDATTDSTTQRLQEANESLRAQGVVDCTEISRLKDELKRVETRAQEGDSRLRQLECEQEAHLATLTAKQTADVEIRKQCDHLRRQVEASGEESAFLTAKITELNTERVELLATKAQAECRVGELTREVSILRAEDTSSSSNIGDTRVHQPIMSAALEDTRVSNVDVDALLQGLHPIEHALAQKESKVRSIEGELDRTVGLLSAGRQMADVLQAHIAENSVLLDQRRRTYDLVREMESYRLNTAQRRAKGGTLRDEGVAELETEVNHLSALLGELGTLLWAASQQSERPILAVERLRDQIMAAMTAVGDARLHCDVMVTLLDVSKAMVAQLITGNQHDFFCPPAHRHAEEPVDPVPWTPTQDSRDTLFPVRTDGTADVDHLPEVSPLAVVPAPRADTTESEFSMAGTLVKDIQRAWWGALSLTSSRQ